MVTGSLATMSAFHLWSQEVKVADFLFYLLIFLFFYFLFLFLFFFVGGGLFVFWVFFLCFSFNNFRPFMPNPAQSSWTHRVTTLKRWESITRLNLVEFLTFCSSCPCGFFSSSPIWPMKERRYWWHDLTWMSITGPGSISLFKTRYLPRNLCFLYKNRVGAGTARLVPPWGAGKVPERQRVQGWVWEGWPLPARAPPGENFFSHPPRSCLRAAFGQIQEIWTPWSIWLS